jgi:hypothetical protein
MIMMKIILENKITVIDIIKIYIIYLFIFYDFLII